jgi:endonuclease-3
MSSARTKTAVKQPRSESQAAKQLRALEIVRRLAREYADAQCALVHRNPLELLVATILSAQCTDVRVNLVTPALFRRYRTAADFASSPPGELEAAVRSTGFFNHKARNIRDACAALVAKHGGEVPRTMAELLLLPGVARKTANVVLGTAFRIAEGVVVDTHVMRIATLLKLTRESQPEKIEQDLVALLPQDEWIDFSHRLIWHGRKVCIARRPKCGACVLSDVCPSAQVEEPLPRTSETSRSPPRRRPAPRTARASPRPSRPR